MAAATRRAQATPDRLISATGAPLPLHQTQERESGLERLIAAEDRIRTSTTRLELEHALANEFRSLFGARQVVVLRKKARSKWKTSCISSMASLDTNAPLVQAMEQFVCLQAAEADHTNASLCFLDATSEENRNVIATYPFREAIWQPIQFRSGPVFAGLLLLRETPWDAATCELLQRQSQMISDTWCAIAGHKSLRPSTGRRKACGLAVGVVALAAMALPVPMTTLAPVEIVARNPELVTAPIDGVIETVYVLPNRKVRAGQPLFQFVDTELRNAYELARREADVSMARHGQLLQAAFSDDKSRHELGIAETEMKLRVAQRDYAQERLSLVTVRAKKNGILIYPDKSKLLGRPVSVGERLMRIAQPGQVSAEVSVPVADAITLTNGGTARLFLDVDPTRSLAATLDGESYHAEPDATGELVYSVRAKLDDSYQAPRIGSRGTAQLFGAPVPLGFFLFRRPISWIRQKFGL